MARKAGQGKEEEESRARQQEEKTPVREEEEKPACHGGAHHVVEQVSKTAKSDARMMTLVCEVDIKLASDFMEDAGIVTGRKQDIGQATAATGAVFLGAFEHYRVFCESKSHYVARTYTVRKQNLKMHMKTDYISEEFLVSLPGFREIVNRGVKVDYLTPDFPSLSYPNYYTLMTELSIDTRPLTRDTKLLRFEYLH
ncbi:hypothetical protein STEG23_019608 [Scotinomys teguina]